jgi:type IV secretory pathway VirB4 component
MSAFVGERPLYLGDAADGDRLHLDERVLAEHMQVIGTTGWGKTKFLEHITRQLVIARGGLCVIDPHGSLYNGLVRWCVADGLFEKRKILLVEPTADGWSFGFNPCDFRELRDDGYALDYVVQSFVGACEQVWGGEDTLDKPLIRRVLPAIIHVLMEKGLTLLEAE